MRHLPLIDGSGVLPVASSLSKASRLRDGRLVHTFVPFLVEGSEVPRRGTGTTNPKRKEQGGPSGFQSGASLHTGMTAAVCWRDRCLG
jgi:hypothetical protein